MTSLYRIGCVPYLNGVPLSAWFESPDCSLDLSVSYQVPSQLAWNLRHGSLDVAMVSIFESFQNPNLRIVPEISVSADGPVKSVRLFSKTPYKDIRTVALDTSSLTSAALTRILLSELIGIQPDYVSLPPNPEEMLKDYDACLIIGDLKLFDSPATHILDLGEGWKELTGLPFVYAAWLESAPPKQDLHTILFAAREWGLRHLEQLAVEASQKMKLPLYQTREYLFKIMQYDLSDIKRNAISLFKEKCMRHNLISGDC